MTNAIPAGVLCAADYTRLAVSALDPALHAHIEGGSADDLTARYNIDAFHALRIVPRILREVRAGSTACRLGGETIAHPILLAPIGWQGTIHQDGEIATAHAATATATRMIVSTQSSQSLEEIAAVTGLDRWFQLYFQPDRGATADLLRRAEQAGYAAIVVTVDTPLQMPSFAAQRAGYRPPPGPATNLGGYPAAPLPADAGGLLGGRLAGAPALPDLEWLMRETGLPVWIKGVLHPDDAKAMRDLGAAGIIASNHGGRALDGAPASLSMLPACRAAVGADYPVLVDGGIRSGSDVFKAIASGADAVLVGRLQAYALAVAGALGVAHMIKLLREELEYCMAMAGCTALADIRAATLIQQGEY